MGLLAVSLSVRSQTYNWEWANFVDGNDTDAIIDVAYDSTQNATFNIANYTSDFSSHFGTNFNASGNSNGLLAKMNADGSVDWTVNFSSSSDIDMRAVDTDALGSIYVVGSFEDDILITSVNATTLSIGSSGGTDAFVCKINSFGNVVWLRRVGNTQDDYATDIFVTQDALYVTGGFRGSVTILGLITINSAGGSDAFLGKYSLTGTELEFENEGSNQNDEYSSVSVEGNNVIVGGHFSGNSINLGGVTTLYNSDTGTNDGMLVRYQASNLNIISGYKLGGVGNNYVNDVGVLNSEFYVTGSYDNQQILGGSATVGNTTSQQGYLAKIVGNSASWVKYSTGTSTNDIAAFVKLKLSDSKCFILANYKGSVEINGTATTPSSNFDPLLFVIDNISGNTLGFEEISGSAEDYGLGLDINDIGEVFISGQFKTNLELNGLSISASGSGDMFWSKLICSQGTTTLSGATTICSGDSALISVDFTGPSDYTFDLEQNGSSSASYSSSTSTSEIYVTPLVNSTYQIENFEANLCPSPSSNTINIDVLPLISNNTIQNDSTLCLGDTAPQLIGTSPSGGNGSYTFQWQLSSDDGATWTSITGGTNQNLNSTITTGSTLYRRIVSSLCSDTSNLVSIRFIAPIANNNISTLETQFCENTDVVFTGSNPTGGNNLFTYQWESSTDDATWVNASNTPNTNSGYTEMNLSSNLYFRRLAATTGCSQDTSYSSSILIEIFQPITNNTISADQTLCTGDTPTDLIGSTPNNGNGSFTYTWEESTDNLSWSSAAGTNNGIDYSPSAIVTTYYRRVVQSATCDDDTSNFVTLTFSTPLSNNNIGNDLQLCDGDELSITGSTPVGGNNIFDYQWEVSSDNNNWNLATGVNDQKDYSLINPTDTFYYRRIVETVGCAIDSLVSNPVQVIVNLNPEIAILISDDVCEGESINVIHTLNQGSLPWSLDYTFENSNTISTINDINYVLSLPAILGTSYSQISVTDVNNCTTNYSDIYNLTVKEIPIADAGTDIMICGTQTTLNPNPSIGTGNFFSPTLTIPATSPYDVTDNSYQNHTVIWTEDNQGCVSSDTMIVRFDQEITEFNISRNDTIYNQIPLKVTAENLGYGEGNWYTNSSSIINSPTDFETDISNFDDGENIFTFEYQNGTCPMVEKSVSILFKPLVIPNGISPNGDGLNDTFEIIGIDNFGSVELRIFNSWGQEIYYSPDYDNSWNGTDEKGNQLSTDSYYYILKMDDESQNGYIILQR